MPENVLYYGDNLDVLRRHVKDESVDLVYLDPPFNSNQNYNVLFAEQDGDRSAAQIKAFTDTWRWDQAAAAEFWEVVEKGGSVKAGKPQVSHLRDLRGVLDREGAEIGVLISTEEPTKPMRAEAADAGVYSSPGWNSKHPRLQLLTVSDILAGKPIDYPHQTASTFKKAPKHELEQPKSDPLF